MIVDAPAPRDRQAPTRESAEVARRRRGRTVPRLDGVWQHRRRDRRGLRFGEHAVRLGLATAGDVERALDAQRHHRRRHAGRGLRIGEVLLLTGILDRSSYRRTLRSAVPTEVRSRGRWLAVDRLGQILLEEKAIEPRALREAFARRKRLERRTGRCPLLSRFLLEQGICTEAQIARARAILERRTAFDRLERRLERSRFVPPVEAFLRTHLERGGLPRAEIQAAAQVRSEAIELLGRRVGLGELLVVREAIDVHIYEALIERHLSDRVEARRPLPHLVIEMIEAHLVLPEHALWVNDLLEKRDAAAPSPERLIQGLVDAGFVAQRDADPYLRRARRLRQGRRGALGVVAVLCVLLLGGWLLGRRPPPPAPVVSAAAWSRARTAAHEGLDRMVAAIEQRLADLAQQAQEQGGSDPMPLEVPPPISGRMPDGSRWRAMAVRLEADRWHIVAFGDADGARVVLEARATARSTPARRDLADMAASHLAPQLEVDLVQLP